VLLSSCEEAGGGSISRETVVGPRDRVRKFNEGGTDSEMDFTYSPGSGFSCKPKGLKFFVPNESFSNTSNNTIVNAITSGATYALSNMMQMVLNPLLCVATLKAFGNAVGGDGLTAAIETIVIALGMEGLSYVEGLIYDEDDYNLDPQNPICLGATIAMFVSCITMMIVSKITALSLPKRIAIIMGISATVQFAKEIFKSAQFAAASQVFVKLSLCGDNWFTYGSSGLEENLVKESRSNTGITLNNIRLNFPLRGSFSGSYSYNLSQCFKIRDMAACEKIFSETTMTTEDVDSRSSLVYKEYREFVYDGIEFAYDGCSDPREERKSYASTPDQTSQLYYFRGNEAAHFACERFMVKGSPEYREAYKCCLDASQKLICIYNDEKIDGKDGKHVMCNKDDSPGKCQIATTVEFDFSDMAGFNSVNTTACDNLKAQTVDNASVCSGESKDTASCSSATKEYNTMCGEGIGTLRHPIENIEGIAHVISGSKPTIGKTVKLKIVQSKFDPTKYCVETYSFCPYDFRLMGGSETYGTEFSSSYESGFKVKLKKGTEEYEQDTKMTDIVRENKKNNCTFDEDGNRHCMGPCYASDSGEISACYNRPSNFCQLDRHCVRIPPLDEKPREYNSPYIDLACINSVGSSHNFTNYEGVAGTTSKSTRLLTTPLVECTVETFKNILLNRAGHTRCVDGNESPSEDDDCASGVLYRNRQNLDGMAEYKNSFKRLKSYMHGVVRALLALAVVLYGYNIAISHKGLTTEELSKFILKLICVSYFSISNNWIPYVFDRVYRVYGIVTEFALGLVAANGESMNYDNPKYSGCYFSDSKYINNHFSSYGDRQYISVFDTMDCKLSRYFGYYTNNLTSPPIIAILIMGVCSLGLAILMMIPVLLIFLSLLFFIIRVSYIFIVNSLTIVILLFLSPIFIPLALFERTKSAFTKWLVGIAQNIMSPLFLFMALSLFFSVFDKYYVGEALFVGTREPIRDVYCGKICKVSESKFFYVGGDKDTVKKQEEECAQVRGNVINLIEDSPLCLMVRAPDLEVDTPISILNMILGGFAGLPGLAIQVANFFQMFSNIIFLLVLIFIFEQMTAYISAMTSALFAYETVGFKGIDNNAEGLPSLKDITTKVASAGAQLANKTKDVGKGAFNNFRNWRNRDK
jgi:hypothetical protein